MDEVALQRMIDESELRNLMSGLPKAIDCKDWNALGALFTEDGVHEVVGRVRSGRQAIIDGPKGDLERTYEATFHDMGQIYVEVTGDEAEIVAYVIAYHIPKRAEPMTHEDAGGKYFATARRTEEGWRLTGARLEIDFLQGAPFSLGH